MRSAEVEDWVEWEARTLLSHAEQIAQYGWCMCEGTKGEGHLAEDCESK